MIYDIKARPKLVAIGWQAFTEIDNRMLNTENIKLNSVSKTPVTPEQLSQGDPTVSEKNAECRGACTTITSITIAKQWHRQ